MYEHNVFDVKLSGYCPTLFAEMQSDTLIKFFSEKATSIKSIEIQLFHQHPQKELSETYDREIDLDQGSYL